MVKLSEKQLLLISIVIILLLMTGPLVFCYLDYSKIQDVKASNKVKNATLKSLETKISGIGELKDEKAVLVEEIEDYEQILPTAEQLEELMMDVDVLSGKSNVKIKSYSFGGISKQEQYDRIAYNISLTGLYFDVATFIYKLERFPRFIEVSSFSIGDRGPKHSVQISIGTYRYSGEVFEEPKDEADATKKQAGQGG